MHRVIWKVSTTTPFSARVFEMCPQILRAALDRLTRVETLEAMVQNKMDVMGYTLWSVTKNTN